MTSLVHESGYLARRVAAVKIISAHVLLYGASILSTSALHITVVMAEDAQKVQQAVNLLLLLIASGRNPLEKVPPLPDLNLGLKGCIAPPQRGKLNMAVAYMSM